MPVSFPTNIVYIDLYHAMTWPSLSYVAENSQGQVVGYILAKMFVLWKSLVTLSSFFAGKKI
jgi:hypothetical protein